MDELSATTRHVLAQRGYTPLKLLAGGAFGKVYQAIRLCDGAYVAIKIVPLSTLRPNEVARIEKEIRILTSVSHPHVLEFHEAFTDSAVLGDHEEDETVFIVTEYLGGGDLFDRITRKLLTEDEAREVARQILSALSYLESMDLCHRDVKLENVCLSETTDGKIHAKLIDFGYATSLHGVKRLSGAQRVGTLNYYPPQIVHREAYDPHRMDIWSLGVVLYSAVSGRFPFYGESEAAIEEMIAERDAGFNETQWTNVSGNFRLLVEEMLSREESLRPTISEVTREMLAFEKHHHQLSAENKAMATRVGRKTVAGRRKKWLRQSSKSSLDIVHAAIIAT